MRPLIFAVIAADAMLLAGVSWAYVRVLRRHRLAERAAAETEARHTTIIRSLADSVIIIDQRGLIKSFSPAAEKTFGYRAEEVLGQNVSILMPSPDSEQHDRYLREYIESGWTSSAREHQMLTGEAQVVRPQRETIALRKDGSRFPVRLLVSEVDDGNERFFIGLLSDVTEQRRAAAELQEAKEKAEQANAIIEAQKRRMQEELDVGRQIQMSMVPTRFPSLADADLWGTLRPAREVGGDLYDFFMPSDDVLWLCIGDVSGKGVPAALLMAVTKTLIKSFASTETSPARVFARVNKELSTGNESSMFVTAFIARLDLPTGRLIYTNAGHNPPLVRRSDGQVERLATRHGPVLGAVEGISFGESEAQLFAGDSLLMYTDGVSEALDRDDHMYGECRLQAVLTRAMTLSAKELASAVVADVDHFSKGAEQADDITVLAFQFGSALAEMSPRPLLVRNDLDDLAVALGKVGPMVAACGGDEAAQTRFTLAFEEVLSNIIKYAFPSNGAHAVQCDITRDGDAILASISDDGIAFDPASVREPDTALPLEARPLGGLGVHLVREMFDDVKYERCGGRNLLTLRQRQARNALDNPGHSGSCRRHKPGI
ncbi:MAG TPA: SpoIIE family protein phosphatase [Gemmatimonadaceae bacterium]|nr:SpoIIE family protein phosphatase [Gemmatimonadaceae bacterium]